MIPQDFQQILQHLQRPINCLADDDRNIRKNGLDTIKKSMNTMSKQNVLKLFNQTKLTAMLTKITNDKIENNRQVGLEITQLLIKIVGADGKNLYEQLLPSLISRVNQTPFPQKSEDLRLKIIAIFIKLIPYKDCFLKCLPQIGSAIAKCLADAYDQIKYSTCELTNKLSQGLPHQIGKYSLNIIISLRDNLKHQKFKVRKTSLQTIGHILITDGAGGNFEQIRVAMKAVLSDKKQEVRLAGFICVSHLLLYLGPKYMKQYQPYLIGFLLMGLDDQSSNIVKDVIQLLQKCGKKLKQEDEQHTMVDQKQSQQIKN